jgi:hypothetical protein
LDYIRNAWIPFDLPNYMHEYEMIDEVFKIVVKRIPLNEPMEDENYFDFKGVYNPDGTEYAVMDYSSNSFTGRKPEENKFKEGDKVSVLCGDYLYNAVVYGLPMQPLMECENYCCDYTDDSYTILMNMDTIPENMTDSELLAAHEHITVDHVFPREEGY